MYSGIYFLLLASLQSCWHTTNANGSLKNNDISKIKYPGPIKESPLNRYGGGDEGQEIPEECKNKLYCSIKPRSYPTERFNNMFKNRTIDQATLVATDLNDRQGDPEERDNCETNVEFDPLYKVRSKLGDWRTVVQAPEKNYVQVVRMETCKEENQPCFTIFPKIPSYQIYCKQKYTTWEFVVEVEGTPGKTEKIQVDLPTCCSCHYKPT